MPVNSRAKGVRGELDAVHALQSLGVPARRTAQYQGQGSDGDIVVPQAKLHIEVKLRRAFSFLRHMEQAMADARHGYKPMLLVKENRGEWFVVSRLADLGEVYRQLEHAMAVASRERGQA